VLFNTISQILAPHLGGWGVDLEWRTLGTSQHSIWGLIYNGGFRFVGGGKTIMGTILDD